MVLSVTVSDLERSPPCSAAQRSPVQCSAVQPLKVLNTHYQRPTVPQDTRARATRALARTARRRVLVRLSFLLHLGLVVAPVSRHFCTIF
jgi:hypothetical protein